MSAFKFTINSFTLLALSLSIGIVVDDAIMVLENIVRYVENGSSRVKAALLGTKEITGAAVAASIAILAIFVPVIFMKGIIGKFFFQFGITMSVAVMLSLLEALTLAPMRCSQFLEPAHETRVGKMMNRWMDGLSARYVRVLTWALAHRWSVVSVSLTLTALSWFLLSGVKKELVPPQDQNRFLVSIQTEMGSSLELTDQVFKSAEDYTRSRPEIEATLSAVGGLQGGLVNQGNMFVMLKEPKDRPILAPFDHRPSQQEFMGLMRKDLSKLPNVKRVSMIDLSLTGFSAQRGYPIQFQVQGPNWEILTDSTKKLMDRMRALGSMTDIDSDYNPHMPEIKVVPDREKAAIRGVTVSNIANAISALVGSLRVGKYTDESGHRDDVRVKLLQEFNRGPSDITGIRIRNNRGEMIPLSEVVRLENRPSMLTISRYNRERAISVFANVAQDKSQAAAMDSIEKAAKEILPEGYHLVISGNSAALKESFESLLWALVLGILVAYMVLGAQFNSFIHPITVLLALPFSLTGAFLALRMTGISLNLYSMIGLLLLMGIVKKNSILLVDFTNQIRRDGTPVIEALLKACPLRLRPILMTSIATVVAAIPAALSIGPGSETTRPMAIVVIGGVILSTLLTLVVVPCAYSLLSALEDKKREAELRTALSELEA